MRSCTTGFASATRGDGGGGDGCFAAAGVGAPTGATAAADGVLALELWRSGRYALLLTDCHMPNMDGFELTATIRREQTTHLPIIAVTANAMQGEDRRCRDAGMDDCLCKPLRLHELGPMLSKWLPHQEPA